MTQVQYETASAPVDPGVLIASKAEEGFRVYSLQTPSTIYQVRNDGERWTCTCPDFEAHKSDTTYRCPHILTVAPWPNGDHSATTPRPDNGHAKDAAIPALPPTEPPTEKKRGRKRSNGSVQMLIKRSVSPDGRIDSVSVEFSMPVADIASSEVKDKAVKTLELQKEIVGAFLRLNAAASPTSTAHPTTAPQSAPKPQTPPPTQTPANGHGKPVHARLIDIAKVNGRYGDRFCINVQVNGRWSRIFGSAEQLAADIAKAGHQIAPADIAPGLRLNLPCLVVTKPSEDGKYVNVEKVLPLNSQPKGGGNGSAIPY